MQLPHKVRHGILTRCEFFDNKGDRIMYLADVDKIANTAVDKYGLAKHKPKKYLMRAIVAGFFVVVAIVFSNVTASVFYENYPEFGKLLAAIFFPISIVLVVFIGGELFTGNNMTMALGAYTKRVTWGNVCRVWAYSYIGNFIGCFIFSAIFIGSGASRNLLAYYMGSTILNKLDVPALQLFLRGVLCNFMVCLAVLTATRMKSESGKLIVMFCLIAAFVIDGFEHSIANMGTFTIAFFLLGGLPMALVVKSMIFVTLGNVVGGAVLLALPLKIMSTKY